MAWVDRRKEKKGGKEDEGDYRQSGGSWAVLLFLWLEEKVCLSIAWWVLMLLCFVEVVVSRTKRGGKERVDEKRVQFVRKGGRKNEHEYREYKEYKGEDKYGKRQSSADIPSPQSEAVIGQKTRENERKISFRL